MRRIFSTLIYLCFIALIIFLSILSTIGIESNRFNNLITKKISNANNNLNIKLSSIKYKFDVKEVSLFLETIEPKINYRKVLVPTKNVKVYIDFFSIFQSGPQIKKVNLDLHQINIEQLKKISVTFKPSNLTSFVNNNLKKGKINSELEIYLSDKNTLDNFIIKGSVSNLKSKIINDINLEKTNFDFFADKSDVLIKNVYGESGPIQLIDGDLKIKLEPEILLESNFKTNLNYKNNLKKYSNLLKDIEFINKITNLEANINNNFNIEFDKTYKIKKYNYKIDGNIIKANLNLKNFAKNSILSEKISELSLLKSNIKADFSQKKNLTILSGEYLLNKENPLPFNLENIIEGEILKLKFNADYI